MRIGIIGAGALGSVVAALLTAAGEADVWLVGGESSGAHFERIARDGLRLDLAESVRAALPKRMITALDMPVRNLHLALDARTAYPCDVGIVLVKHLRTAEAGAQAAQCLSPDGVAVTLQNGLGNVEILARYLEPARLAQGVTQLGATLVAPAHVKVNALLPTSIGTPPSLPFEQVKRLDALAEALNAAHMPTRLVVDIAPLVWRKLVINCAVNGIGALLDVPNGALPANEDSARLLGELAREAARVGLAHGVALPFDEDGAAETALEAARLSATNINSMLQDIRRGRPTEIDAINGALARLGEALGVATPYNHAVTWLIRARQGR